MSRVEDGCIVVPPWMEGIPDAQPFADQPDGEEPMNEDGLTHTVVADVNVGGV